MTLIDLIYHLTMRWSEPPPVVHLQFEMIKTVSRRVTLIPGRRSASLFSLDRIIMRLPKFRWVFLAGALIGGIVPMLFFTLHAFQEFIVGGRGAFLWPSGIWLMATDGHEHEIGAYVVIGMSIVANMLLYAVVSSLVWCAGWVLRAWRDSISDGPTI